MIELHQQHNAQFAGATLDAANAVLLLIHGRGSSATSILQLGHQLKAEKLALVAPQAANNTWYPYSFLAPLADNQPWLDSALQTIDALLQQIEAAGIDRRRIVLAGFSQGACLASEYVARNAQRYGGLIAFSGGLIGPPDTPRNYRGDLAATPTFIGCSDRDAHIPLFRVEETAATLTELGAAVDKIIYPNMGHTINADEIERASKIVASVAKE